MSINSLCYCLRLCCCLSCQATIWEKLIKRNPRLSAPSSSKFEISARGHFLRGFVLAVYFRYTADNFNETPSSCNNLSRSNKQALILFLRAIRAKAKFCEHCEIGLDHAIPLTAESHLATIQLNILR